MKDKIIEILKDSGTIPAVIKTISGEYYGIYIWENDVFVLTGGMDLEFDSLKELEKESILYELEVNNYTLNPDYQG